ncbi:MAG: hypothetical protein RLZZ514_567 [Actinomycetota bacterium]|jgi:hypothetical protein
MVPDATKWIIDTVSLVAVIGVIIAFAVWTSGTNKR